MTTLARQPMIDRLQFEADLCRAHFYSFVRRFWPVVCPEDPVWNWHIPYICDELQAVAMRVFQRLPKEYDLIINVSPGSTKSIICSEMFPVWCWTNDPTFRTICASYAYPLALYLASHSQRIIMSDKFRQMYPELTLNKESVGLMETKQGGWRYATSTGGAVTGLHGHCLIVDDPINPKEAMSEVQLRSANDWLDQTLPSRVVSKKITPTILIMQRLHCDDPTGHRLDKQGGTPIRHICLPAELTPDVRPRSCRAKYVNGLFDPIRLPREVLKAAEMGDMGNYGYAGQYLQRPVPLGGGMFRTDQIKIVENAPAMVKVWRCWDKAGTGGDGAFTVGVKLGMCKDRSFVILDVVRGQWEAAERERIIQQTAAIDGRGVWIGVEQEPGSGGKESAQGTLKRLAGYRVRLDRPVGKKELRADPLAAQVNGGNVRMVRAPWNSAYLAEMSFFPFSKYKDQVDATSLAFAMLTGRKLMVGGFG